MARKTKAEQADELAAALGLSIQEGLNKKFKNTNYKKENVNAILKNHLYSTAGSFSPKRCSTNNGKCEKI